MFTLIGLGVSVAYVYSLIAALLPGIFPDSFRDEHGTVAVYFDAAAVIVTLILLGVTLVKGYLRGIVLDVCELVLGPLPDQGRRLVRS